MLAKKIKESIIQKQIIKYLREEGYFATKVPLGPMMVHSGQKSYYAPNPLKGFPDIMGFYKDNKGRMFVIEVKGPKGVLRPEQKVWKIKLESLGVPYCLARSVEDVITFLDKEDDLFFEVSA